MKPLLMIEILQDFICKKPRDHGSMVYYMYINININK